MKDCPYEYPMFRVCWIDRIALKKARERLSNPEKPEDEFLCYALPWWAVITRFKIRKTLVPAASLDGWIFMNLMEDNEPISEYFDCGLPKFELSRVEWVDKLLDQS